MKHLKLLTRAFAILAAVATAAVGYAASSAADEYPSRPVTMLVPYGAGGLSDTMARVMANALEKELGGTIAVVNKKGASGTIGLTALSRAKSDGYTIMTTPAAPLINQPHLRKLPYDVGSFTYICQFFNAPLALAIAPGSSFGSLKDVIAYAKANPKKLTYGTAGPGTIPHVAMVRVLQGADAQMRHVPLAGDAGTATALLGGHIDVGMINTTTLAKKQAVRGLTVFAPERSEQFPKLETAREAGFDYVLSVWGGVIAPKGIPEASRKKLGEACARATATEDFKQRLKALSTKLEYLDGVNFEQLARTDSATSGKVIASVGLTGKK